MKKVICYFYEILFNESSDEKELLIQAKKNYHLNSSIEYPSDKEVQIEDFFSPFF